MEGHCSLRSLGTNRTCYIAEGIAPPRKGKRKVSLETISNSWTLTRVRVTEKRGSVLRANLKVSGVDCELLKERRHMDHAPSGTGNPPPSVNQRLDKDELQRTGFYKAQLSAKALAPVQLRSPRGCCSKHLEHSSSHLPTSLALFVRKFIDNSPSINTQTLHPPTPPPNF